MSDSPPSTLPGPQPGTEPTPGAGAVAVRLSRRARDGRIGEVLAAWWLRLHGWSVIARNRRVASVEVDLIVRRGRIEALVEVKTRRVPRGRDRLVEPQHLLTEQQRCRLLRAVEARARTAREAGARRTLRADLVEVVLGSGLPHFRRHVDVAAWSSPPT